MFIRMAATALIAFAGLSSTPSLAQAPKGQGTPISFVGPPPERMKGQKPNRDDWPFHAQAGVNSNLYEYFNLDQNCAQTQFKVRVEVAPQHGKVAVVRAPFTGTALVARTLSTPLAGQADSRKACRLDYPEGMLVTYRPDEGYSGSDYAVITVDDHEFSTTEYISLTVN